MQTPSGSPIASVIPMFVIAFWLLRCMGAFRGFITGFWSGFWTRMFVGTLRSRSGSGWLGQFIKIIVAAVIILILLACLGGPR